jgi:hypothetical protein
VALAADMDRAARGCVDLSPVADSLFTTFLADYPAEELAWMEAKYAEEVCVCVGGGGGAGCRRRLAWPGPGSFGPGWELWVCACVLAGLAGLAGLGPSGQPRTW